MGALPAQGAPQEPNHLHSESSYKRLSESRFRCWPSHGRNGGARLEAHELQVLVFGGDPSAAKAAPFWRRVGPRAA